MSVYAVIDLNIFLSLILLMIVILINQKQSFKSYSSRLFMQLCLSTIALLALDAFSWAVNGTGYLIEYVSVFLFYLVEPIPLVIWLCYLDYHLYRSIARLKRRWYYVQPFIIVAVLLIVNFFTRIIFHVDGDNMYRRGYGIAIILVMNLGILLYTIFIAVKERKKLERKVFAVIVLFGVIPLAGSIVQILVYGASVLWNAVALSIVFVYLVIETQKEMKDYLTGLLNRQQIDDLIISRMIEYEKRGAFSIVMLDMDNLKRINDTFGHKEGDRALIRLSQILDLSVKRIDKVARFGGDEFIILLEEDHPAYIEDVIDRIKNALLREITENERPYELSVSTGYAVYSPAKYRSFQELLGTADKNMYAQKQGKHNPRV